MVAPLVVALWGVVGCSTHRNHMDVRSSGQVPGDARISEPVFVEDHTDDGNGRGPLPASDDSTDPLENTSFRANTVVGNVRFGRDGYIVADTPDGQFNVSKSLTITNRDKYRTQVADWLTGAFDQPLRPIDDLDLPPVPERRDQRGTSSRDGRDNISLPRGIWSPVPADDPSWTEPLVVPWVVGYTSHNAGWFFGQTYGTPAGARIHVLLVAYDSDGSVLGWTDVNASRISERNFKPTGPELQDLLLKLERRVARKLR